MALLRVRAENFKSFRSIDVSLGSTTVLIGANGAGKSNFFALLRFIRDLHETGLDNAISLQGGPRYVRNIQNGKGPLVIEVTAAPADRVDPPTTVYPVATGGSAVLRLTRLDYRLVVESTSAYRYAVSEERVTQCVDVVWAPYEPDERRPSDLPTAAELVLTRTAEGTSFRAPALEKIEGAESWLQVMRTLVAGFPDAPQLLIQENVPLLPEWTQVMSSIGFYDIDPRVLKQAIPFTAKAELEEDGSNLAVVLSSLLRKPTARDELETLLQDMLPFIERVRVQRFADTSMLFKARETYWGGVDFPASLLSDGTVRLTALIVALFFERRQIAMIEEPERAIHPSLIARLVQLLYQASSLKQVLVATQHPEVIRHTQLDDMLLVRRQKNGFTVIEPTADEPHVEQFLRHELGLPSLYVQDLLEY